MFDRGNLSLFPHAYKPAGIGITALALMAWLFINISIELAFIATATKTDKSTLLKLINWVGVIGLFMIAFSREKKEDEHVQLIRNTIMRGTFKHAFSFMVSVQLPVSFFLKDGYGFFTPFVLATFFLLLYVIQFNYSLRFTPKYIYEPDPGKNEPFKSKVSTSILTFFWAAMAFMLIMTIVVK